MSSSVGSCLRVSIFDTFDCCQPSISASRAPLRPAPTRTAFRAGSVNLRCNFFLFCYLRPALRRPSKAMSKAIQGGLPPVRPPLAALPGRVEVLQIARYRRFRAACSVGKWPRAFTALLSLALMDSMALVVQMTVLISRSNCRKGTDSAHAFCPEPYNGRVALLPLTGELGEPVERLGLGRGRVNRLEVPRYLRPVPFRGVLE